MNHPADPRETHKSHCCVRHGCKYGEPDCPVASGEVEQLYDCESCAWDKEEFSELEELRLYKSEHERLKEELNQILHPNGDGPKAPSFCDLVAYVRGDLRRLRKDIQLLEEDKAYFISRLENEGIH